MQGENGRPDRLEGDPTATELTEVEQGKIIDADRKAARDRDRAELEDRLRAEGKLLDLKSAMLRNYGPPAA